MPFVKRSPYLLTGDLVKSRCPYIGSFNDNISVHAFGPTSRKYTFRKAFNACGVSYPHLHQLDCFDISIYGSMIPSIGRGTE